MFMEFKKFMDFPINPEYMSPKFKRVLLNETPLFPFRGLNICVDFDLRYSKNGKYEENK